MHVVNALMNLVTLACVVGLAVWAWRRGRADAARHRAVVREIGRLRMAERDSTELSRRVQQIRAAVEGAYASGFVDGMGDRKPVTDPSLRVVR